MNRKSGWDLVGECVCTLVISGSAESGLILHASHRAWAGSSGQVLWTAELLSGLAQEEPPSHTQCMEGALRCCVTWAGARLGLTECEMCDPAGSSHQSCPHRLSQPARAPRASHGDKLLGAHGGSRDHPPKSVQSSQGSVRSNVWDLHWKE